MPYFIYKVFSGKRVELLEEYEKFREAKVVARQLRTESSSEAEIKIVFADNPSTARLLLREEREPQPRGDD